jgi:uncharacterized protein
MKKSLFIIAVFAALTLFIGGYFLDKTGNLTTNIFGPALVIPEISITSDYDNDGIDDQHDILEGAKNQIGVTTSYDGSYFENGYPPENTGVCTDVIWRSFKNAGYNLKELIDEDIKNHPDDYSRIETEPDPNIDFRRVPNQISFFEKYAKSLTTEVKPNDIENLKEWQGGDIVVYEKLPTSALMHIAIISDKRRKDGVPYIIHNYGYGTKEDNLLTLWPTKIIGHYRFPLPK